MAGKQQKKSGGSRKFGRNKRRIRYPLMPQYLSVGAAIRWYNQRYAQSRNEAKQF